MKRMILLFLIFLFLLTSCSKENNNIDSTPVIIPSQNTESSSNIPDSQNERATLMDFQIPKGLSSDMEKLPLVDYYEINWCVTQEEFPCSYDKQWFSDNKEANTIAGYLSKFTAENSFTAYYENWTQFDSISEANEEELLWTAVGNAPSSQLKVTYESSADTVANKVSFGDEKIAETSLGKLIIKAAEQGVCITEIRYSDDVEATFHWFYGENVPYKPKNLERFGWRYIEELGIFVTDSEMENVIYTWNTQQIISMKETDGFYYIESVPSSNHLDEDWILSTYDYPAQSLKISEDNKKELLKGAHYFYKLKKVEDGHFIICGFRFEYANS